MDAAVVEDKVHAGKLLPRLLRLQIQLYNTSVTYEEKTPYQQYFYNFWSVRLLLS